MDENRVYFPLYGFTVDSHALPIRLSDTLIIRDASYEEKELFGRIQPRHWSEMARATDMQPFTTGSVHDLFVPILAETGLNNNGHKALERALLLLHENIRFGDMYIHDSEGKIRKRQGYPSNQIHIEMQGQIYAERRKFGFPLAHLGDEQIEFLRACLQHYRSNITQSKFVRHLLDLEYIPQNRPSYFVSAMALVDGMLCHESERANRDVIARRMGYFYSEVLGTLSLTKDEPIPANWFKHSGTSYEEVWRALYSLRSHYAHDTSDPVFGSKKLENLDSFFNARLFLNHGIRSLLRWQAENPREFKIFIQ